MELLTAMLAKMGIPYAYDHFAEGEAPELPFLCYLLPGSTITSPQTEGRISKSVTNNGYSREFEIALIPE